MQAEQILQEALANAEGISAHRRWLHAHPGAAFDIADTVDYVEKTLTKLGYAPKRCGKAGLVALAGGKKPGKVFMLRADMDALPMKEDSGEPFAAESGCMHACGHDMHTAMLLEAARLLKLHEDEIEGTVKLMFQPAEEVFGGAKDMIESGLLEEPAVDAAMMLHMMAGMPFAPGTVIVPAGGPSSPAADYFEIHVQGKGCHGSMPHNGVDSITAAAHILIALQELQARELPLGERAVLTIGTIHGGTASNAIADTTTMGGTLRSFDEDTRAMLKRRMEEIAKGVATAFRAEANVVFTSGCPVLVNDPTLAKEAEAILPALLGERCLTPAMLAAMFAGKKNTSAGGSEDFAYVGQNVPVLMLALAGGRPQDGHTWPLHHPMVTFDEAALPYGAAVHVCMALQWLKNNK